MIKKLVKRVKGQPQKSSKTIFANYLYLNRLSIDNKYDSLLKKHVILKPISPLTEIELKIIFSDKKMERKTAKAIHYFLFKNKTYCKNITIYDHSKGNKPFPFICFPFYLKKVIIDMSHVYTTQIGFFKNLSLMTIGLIEFIYPEEITRNYEKIAVLRNSFKCKSNFSLIFKSCKYVLDCCFMNKNNNKSLINIKTSRNFYSYLQIDSIWEKCQFRKLLKMKENNEIKWNITYQQLLSLFFISYIK